MMKRIIFALFFSMLATACGKNESASAPPGLPAAAPASPTLAELEQAEIDNIIYQENLNRYYNLNTAQLTKGLMCRVYKYANSGNISIASGLGTQTLQFSYPYVGYFAHETGSQSDGINFLPDFYRYQPQYQQEIYVDCQGSIVITETKMHEFEAFSDDNLILTVNAIKLVNDDTSHGMYSTASGGLISLKEGQIVSIRIQYRQQNGAMALKLYHNNDWLQPKYLYH